MAWLTSLPDAVVVSVSRYYESRTSPDDAEITQVRDKYTSVREYRGVDYETALNATLGYPVTDPPEIITRSLQAIGGGGYVVIETRDGVAGNWENAPEV